MVGFYHCIYIMINRNGEYKIGVSRDPKQRAATLSNERKRKDVRLVYFREVERDGFAVERFAQCLLASYHIGGEWFEVTFDQAKAAVDCAADSAACGLKIRH